MTRAEWKDLFEGIGFAAIIASLIFVGIETRNSTRQAELNTQALEIAAYQELMDNIAELNLMIVENQEAAALMYKAFNTEEALSDLEEFRFGRAIYARLRHGDMAYFQFQRGVISEDRLKSVIRVLNLGNPRIRKFWEFRQKNFVDPYRNYINARIEEIEVAQALEQDSGTGL
jgi:hypothetical protein